MKKFDSFEFKENQVKDYRDVRSNNTEIVERLVKSGFFRDSKDILDVGCGDGLLTAAFGERLPHASILGCDVSKTMITYALKHHNSSNVTFVEKNAGKLDFGKQFDTVISINCLHWIKNQRIVLEEIFKVLKPGGKAFLVATPNSKNNDFKTVCQKVIFSLKWLPQFLTFRSVHSFHTKEEYEKLLKGAGFIINKIEIKPSELIFKDREALEPFLKAVVTPLEHLDRKYQPDFLEDIIHALVKLGKVHGDGSIHLCYDQIEILVSKN